MMRNIEKAEKQVYTAIQNRPETAARIHERPNTHPTAKAASTAAHENSTNKSAKSPGADPIGTRGFRIASSRLASFPSVPELTLIDSIPTSLYLVSQI